MRTRTFTRTLLREQTRSWILDGIVEGEFVGGETMYEKEIAAELRISPGQTVESINAVVEQLIYPLPPPTEDRRSSETRGPSRPLSAR